jgi:hypothetical protein
MWNLPSLLLIINAIKNDDVEPALDGLAKQAGFGGLASPTGTSALSTLE